MAWYVYLLLSIFFLGFIGVMIYWISLKRHGRKILDDECHMSGKDLVRLYRIRKKAEMKAKARTASNSSSEND